MLVQAAVTDWREVLDIERQHPCWRPIQWPELNDAEALNAGFRAVVFDKLYVGRSIVFTELHRDGPDLFPVSRAKWDGV